ncbi:hypothetical protein GE061_001307 [Apolygus lucorum]|uniref:Uncharacterized protein n=1 Tax=Apolygus lucorum TaxID=248454 RepID=A0A8S9YAC8_APOLU|nr:hypothetical protein GE061_001307 [Apolygus lucorum]
MIPLLPDSEEEPASEAPACGATNNGAARGEVGVGAGAVPLIVTRCRETGFMDQLQRLCEKAAYPISNLLLKPFPQTSTEDHAIYLNRTMSAMRQAVEWGFEKVVRDWDFVDFHKNLKILKEDVASMYNVACLLSNCLSCLYGSQVSDFFSINAAYA